MRNPRVLGVFVDPRHSILRLFTLLEVSKKKYKLDIRLFTVVKATLILGRGMRPFSNICSRFLRNQNLYISLQEIHFLPFQDNTALNSVENHCRSADAIILLYAINDHSSLEEAERLKFLIDTTRKRRRFSVNNKVNKT